MPTTRFIKKHVFFSMFGKGKNFEKEIDTLFLQKQTAKLFLFHSQKRFFKNL